MTVLVGYHCGKETWGGCDTLQVGGSFRGVHGICKLVRIGPWVMGWAGSTYTTVKMRLGNGWAEQVARAADPMQVAAVMQAFFAEERYKRAEDEGGPPFYKQCGILLSQEGVWELSGNGIALQSDDGFCATGSGYEVATGAAWAARQTGCGPRQTVELAVRAAMTYLIDCGGDPIVRRIDEF